MLAIADNIGNSDMDLVKGSFQFQVQISLMGACDRILTSTNVALVGIK